MSAPSWASCPELRPGASGSGACCVHVEDCSEGFGAPFLSFFCCWCGTAVPHPQAEVPPLPAAAGTEGGHGPFVGSARAARPSDLQRA